MAEVARVREAEARAAIDRRKADTRASTMSPYPAYAAVPSPPACTHRICAPQFAFPEFALPGTVSHTAWLHVESPQLSQYEDEGGGGEGEGGEGLGGGGEGGGGEGEGGEGLGDGGEGGGGE
eukprot:scaffold96376_cov39-Phaeocystis_antarctica.AAC.1